MIIPIPRELDAIVAKKVMGLNVVGRPASRETDRVFLAPFGADNWWVEDETGQPTFIPAYSTDIKAAWTVVETLVKNKWDFSIRSLDDGWFEVSFIYHSENNETLEHIEWQDFGAPHAICLAALKAVGVDVS